MVRCRHIMEFVVHSIAVINNTEQCNSECCDIQQNQICFVGNMFRGAFDDIPTEEEKKSMPLLIMASLKQYTFLRLIIVYYLGSQKLRFVASMSEQIGNPTIYFPKVSGGPC